ncbi:MAG: hypothetical protein EAZ09_03615 [Oscillatoriales cyanobacterium]|nr:MAG: hypothetical protein EAZ18_00900 [Oscillatoriales cyanobacterium]TAH24593.1 MAG: hypothetical protein EAZ09_03615 [Oscillatoriales cyanobacterium]
MYSAAQAAVSAATRAKYAIAYMNRAPDGWEIAENRNPGEAINLKLLTQKGWNFMGVEGLELAFSSQPTVFRRSSSFLNSSRTQQAPQLIT